MNRVSATTESVVHDGVEIAFDIEGHGPDVVWLHGITEDRTSWTPVTSRLTGEMRCIRLDFRGHGQSQRLQAYDVAGLLADLAAVIDATCTAPPVVIGHSLGGAVATGGAALGLTGATICVDQPLELAPVAEAVHLLASRLRDPALYADALMEVKRALGIDLVSDPIHADLERKSREIDQRVVLSLWEAMLDGDEDGVRVSEAMLAEMFGNIRVPYLAVHGQPLKAGYEEWFRATNSNAMLEMWDGLGHWLHLVDPERFANRVREFVADPRQSTYLPS